MRFYARQKFSSLFSFAGVECFCFSDAEFCVGFVERGAVERVVEQETTVANKVRFAFDRAAYSVHFFVPFTACFFDALQSGA